MLPESLLEKAEEELKQEKTLAPVEEQSAVSHTKSFPKPKKAKKVGKKVGNLLVVSLEDSVKLGKQSEGSSVNTRFSDRLKQRPRVKGTILC